MRLAHQIACRLARDGEERRIAERARHDATERLRQSIREAAIAGWTKTRIAEVAGISRQTVHKILRDG